MSAVATFLHNLPTDHQLGNPCDDCGSTTDRHGRLCERYGVGSWSDEFADCEPENWLDKWLWRERHNDEWAAERFESGRAVFEYLYGR